MLSPITCVSVDYRLVVRQKKKYTPTDSFFGDFAHWVLY